MQQKKIENNQKLQIGTEAKTRCKKNNKHWQGNNGATPITTVKQKQIAANNQITTTNQFEQTIREILSFDEI